MLGELQDALEDAERNQAAYEVVAARTVEQEQQIAVLNEKLAQLTAELQETTQKADAWDRRKRSSEALKEYLDAWGKWKKTIVLGDWNDDVDKSIFSNYATPFSARSREPRWLLFLKRLVVL